ncbi:MAG TPA: hypothetical protein GXX51_11130 [Firmicutes bacterium]|nr:hypothetical protein [Bacillota bacterium]
MLLVRKGRLGWKAFALWLLGLFIFIGLGIYVASRGSGDLIGANLNAQLGLRAGEIARDALGALKKGSVAIRRIIHMKIIHMK